MDKLFVPVNAESIQAQESPYNWNGVHVGLLRPRQGARSGVRCQLAPDQLSPSAATIEDRHLQEGYIEGEVL